MPDLLRALRVVGAVLRLVGRHRLASVVAVVLAVGWFIYGIGPAGAATVVAPLGPFPEPRTVSPGLAGFAVAVSLGFAVLVARLWPLGPRGTHRDRDGDRAAGTLPGGRHAR